MLSGEAFVFQAANHFSGDRYTVFTRMSDCALPTQVGLPTQAQYHKVVAARTRFSMARKATKQEACIRAGMALHLAMGVEDHLEEELHLTAEYHLMAVPHQEACQEAEEVDQDHHHQVFQVCQQVHHRARYSP